MCCVEIKSALYRIFFLFHRTTVTYHDTRLLHSLLCRDMADIPETPADVRMNKEFMDAHVFNVSFVDSKLPKL